MKHAARPALGRRLGAGARRLAGKLVLLATSATLALFLAEGLVRLLQPQPLILLRPDIWQPHDGLGLVQARHLDTRVNTGEREVRLLTDAEGHRIGPEPRPPAAHSILALGDSYLAALQVEYEQTLTALTERRLTVALGEQVEVVNASVGGWGPSHYLLKARTELARRDYDLVAVFLYLGNDVEERKIDHFGPLKSTVRHRLRWPRRWNRSEIIKSWLYPVNDFLETRSHFYILFKKRLTFVLMRLGLSARHFPDVLLRAQASAERWGVTAEVCRALADETEGRDIPILFVLLPGVCEVDLRITELYGRALGIDPEEIDPDQPSRRMLRELDARGLSVLDTTPALRAAHAAGREDLYGRIDVHFGVTGHQVVAEILTPRLLELISIRRPLATDPQAAF